MFLIKLKDTVDGKCAVLITESIQQAQEMIDKHSTIKTFPVKVVDLNEIKEPLIIYNNILPF